MPGFKCAAELRSQALSAELKIPVGAFTGTNLMRAGFGDKLPEGFFDFLLD